MTDSPLGTKPAGSSPIRLVLTALCCLFLASCAVFKPKEPGIGETLGWDQLTGWQQDRHAEAWPALQSNCRVLGNKAHWSEICTAMENLQQTDDNAVREFMENWFVPHRLYGERRKETGLITGYYEPLLFGQYQPDDRYRYPLYRQPDDLLIVDLGELYPSLKNKRVRGMLQGNRVIPYFERSQIDSGDNPLAGNELIWLDDRDAVFFLHIQGSGRVQLPDGSIVGVGYSNQNGHPYVAIGKLLIQWEELSREEISLFTIRQWLEQNPERADDLLFNNPSYVFFVLRENPEKGPIGSLNTVLTPERSLAIDPKLVSLGTPIWLETNFPGEVDQPYRRLVIAQDTGGAIKGPLRADLFWGHGDRAEYAAGVMKESGSMIVLLPKSLVTEYGSD